MAGSILCMVLQVYRYQRQGGSSNLIMLLPLSSFAYECDQQPNSWYYTMRGNRIREQVHG